MQERGDLQRVGCENLDLNASSRVMVQTIVGMHMWVCLGLLLKRTSLSLSTEMGKHLKSFKAEAKSIRIGLQIDD